MKLLLDESFPQHTIALSRGEVEIRRADTSTLADEELIQSAAEQGCHGVVFLGEEFASREELLRVAEDSRVTLIAVAHEDPESGNEYLRRNLAALVKTIGTSSAVIIWSNRVESELTQEPSRPPENG